MTKDSLHQAGKNGKHSYGENLHNAGKNGEHSFVENFHGDNLNPHNINKLSCTHKSLQETQHLCHPEHCLIFVAPEHQHSCVEITHGNSTKRHIKSNQHMCNPHAFNNYVKTILNHGPASQTLTWVISKENQQIMDLASWKLTGKKNSSPTTHQVDTCSSKLSGEQNSESTI